MSKEEPLDVANILSNILEEELKKVREESFKQKKMRDKIEELLDMSDPVTKSHYMVWDSGDSSEVGLCEILLDQLIRKHKEDNGEYYDTDYDQIKLRYQKEDE